MHKNRQFQQHIKQQFDQQEIDRDTKNALRQAAINALDNAGRSSAPYWFGVTTVFASLILVITLVWVSGPIKSLPAEPVDDLAIINSEDALEMYQDLEFFIWLDAEEKV